MSVTYFFIDCKLIDDIKKACCVLQNFACKGDGFNFEDMEYGYKLVDNLPNREVRSQGIDVIVFYEEHIMY